MKLKEVGTTILHEVQNRREKVSFMQATCTMMLLMVTFCIMWVGMIYVGKDYNTRCHKWWQRIETVVNGQNLL